MFDIAQAVAHLNGVRTKGPARVGFCCPLRHRKRRPDAEIFLDDQDKPGIVCYDDASHNSELWQIVIRPLLPERDTRPGLATALERGTTDLRFLQYPDAFIVGPMEPSTWWEDGYHCYDPLIALEERRRARGYRCLAIDRLGHDGVSRDYPRLDPDGRITDGPRERRDWFDVLIPALDPQNVGPSRYSHQTPIAANPHKHYVAFPKPRQDGEYGCEQIGWTQAVYRRPDGSIRKTPLPCRKCDRCLAYRRRLLALRYTHQPIATTWTMAQASGFDTPKEASEWSERHARLWEREPTGKPARARFIWRADDYRYVCTIVYSDQVDQGFLLKAKKATQKAGYCWRDEVLDREIGELSRWVQDVITFDDGTRQALFSPDWATFDEQDAPDYRYDDGYVQSDVPASDRITKPTPDPEWAAERNAIPDPEVRADLNARDWLMPILKNPPPAPLTDLGAFVAAGYQGPEALIEAALLHLASPDVVEYRQCYEWVFIAGELQYAPGVNHGN